jgi:hypothetical protein
MDDRYLSFYKKVAHRFPNDWILQHQYACALGFAKRFAEASQQSEATFKKLDPKRDGHKYWEEAYVLGATRVFAEKYEQALEAYHLYDLHAPINHRKKPEAFFASHYCRLMLEGLGGKTDRSLNNIIEQENMLRSLQLEFFRNDSYPSLEELKAHLAVQKLLSQPSISASSSSEHNNPSRITHPGATQARQKPESSRPRASEKKRSKGKKKK